VLPAIATARAERRASLIEFRVEQEDSVYPMVPAGGSLGEMIRRPNPLIETATDA
jgi:acetolactate synthase I/II/III large subunit